jgi:exopolysaccharide production protein ExoY
MARYDTFAPFERAMPMADGLIQDHDSIAKIAFDRVAALLALIIVAPLMLGVILWIAWRDPGPILFAHPRIGKQGRMFYCLKFRTMAADTDAILARHLADNPDAADEWRQSRKLRDDPRITPLGATLRRTSLDELPQLLNILKGEMSFVGPRPIVPAESWHYGHAISDYLSVRPGLTGLWQVSGRSDTGYHDRVRLDQLYVSGRTFWRDLVILWKTVGVVLGRKGSY